MQGVRNFERVRFEFSFWLSLKTTDSEQISSTMNDRSAPHNQSRDTPEGRVHRHPHTFDTAEPIDLASFLKNCAVTSPKWRPRSVPVRPPGGHGVVSSIVAAHLRSYLGFRSPYAANLANVCRKTMGLACRICGKTHQIKIREAFADMILSRGVLVR